MTQRSVLQLFAAALAGASAVLLWQHFTRVPVFDRAHEGGRTVSAASGPRAPSSTRAAARPAQFRESPGAATPPPATEPGGAAAAGERKLRSRYASERIDPSWGPATEQTLRRLSGDPLIAGLDAVPDRFQVDCRASTCRVDAVFVSSSQANDFFSIFTMVAAPYLEKQSLKLTPAKDGVHAEIFGMAPR